MQINRDNYEVYFLLYVDNELSAAERNDMEVFISQNPDLKDEFELLQTTTLPAEEMIFIPKTLLYKNDTAAGTVQTSLLLHMDNELSKEDAAKMDLQISNDQHVAAEWVLLKKTRLDPHEKIIFTEKASLYRHTDNVRTLRYWRAAAAAILIGAGLFTGISLYNNTTTDQMAVHKKDNGSISLPSEVKPVKQNEVAIEKENIAEGKKLLAAQPVVPPAQHNFIKDDHNKPSSVLKNINNANGNETVKQIVSDKKQDMKAIAKPEEINIIKMPQGDDMAVMPPSKIKKVDRPLTDTDISDVKENYAKLAVNQESDDQILYMNEDKVTRSKIGGFFRKVKRVVERNTKIKTSNGLRIGGFEFAVK